MITPASKIHRPAREAVIVWALVLAALAAFKLAVAPFVPMGGGLTGALAVALFLWAPSAANRRVGRADEDYGLNFDRIGRDVLFAVVVMAVVFPLFALAFRGFLWSLDHVFSREVGRFLAPYGVSVRFAWRAPSDLLDKIAGNLAVAIGEEFFYRGYLLRRFTERWPPRFRLLGAPFGRALVLQSVFFALGHLLTPSPFRLATFFPGLLFGWMAARTGRVVAPALVHLGSNLLIATLEASAFGY